MNSYLDYLPALFQQDADADGATFLGRFLLAFEHVLSGLGDPDSPGLEEIIARIHTHFDPGPGQPSAERAPDDFLPWLASWVALTLRDDWSSEEKRRFISRIVPAYRRRGTRAGLIEVLQAYTGGAKIEVNELQRALQIGVTSIVGEDTLLGGNVPHYFEVKLPLQDMSGQGAVDIARKEQIARAIIDQEKPAHTYYKLQIVVTHTLQVGAHSTVGQDTFLGDIPN